MLFLRKRGLNYKVYLNTNKRCRKLYNVLSPSNKSFIQYDREKDKLSTTFIIMQ